jgi:hypothetical protein
MTIKVIQRKANVVSKFVSWRNPIKWWAICKSLGKMSLLSPPAGLSVLGEVGSWEEQPNLPLATVATTAEEEFRNRPINTTFILPSDGRICPKRP